ncbi:MAG: helix-turn-helix transcriptional regulator [Phycisphaerales bacterium JB038]
MSSKTHPPDAPASPILGEPLLAPAALATELGVTTKTLERWRMTGDGPPFLRISRKVIRYRKADVEAFLAGRVAASTASEAEIR